jgi:hypothetical protein
LDFGLSANAQSKIGNRKSQIVYFFLCMSLRMRRFLLPIFRRRRGLNAMLISFSYRGQNRPQPGLAAPKKATVTDRDCTFSKTDEASGLCSSPPEKQGNCRARG